MRIADLGWCFSSAVRRGEEIGGRNDACDEMSSGQAATSVALSRGGLGGGVRGIEWPKRVSRTG